MQNVPSSESQVLIFPLFTDNVQRRDVLILVPNHLMSCFDDLDAWVSTSERLISVVLK